MRKMIGDEFVLNTLLVFLVELLQIKYLLINNDRCLNKAGATIFRLLFLKKLTIMLLLVQ